MNTIPHVSLERATQLLKQILATHSPEIGAKLKQRLSASLREQGSPAFDEKAFGFKSFKAFLEKTQGEWVELSRPTSGTDILIALRHEPGEPSASAPGRGALPHFRNEVWQAFTNPDASRQRYLNKKTGEVLHFKLGEGSSEEAGYAAAQDDYAEIEFVKSGQQLAWMEEFLNAVPVVGDERQAYESMMAAPFSSAVNAAFTRALGAKQGLWREFRTSRVSAIITEWADKRSVPRRWLERELGTANVDSSATNPPVLASSSKVPHVPRHEAAKLLELLSDDEIQSAVIPVMLNTMLLRSRV